MKYRFGHIVEYLLFRAVSGFINLLPERGAFAVGWGLAFVMFRLAGFRREMAHQRIREVFGNEMPEAQVRKTAWIAFRNVAFHLIEVMRGHRVNEQWIKTHILNPDLLKTGVTDKLEPGQGAIFTLPHSDNWDLSMIVIAAMGVPVFAISAPQKNPLYNEYIMNMRQEVMKIDTLMRGDKSLGRQVMKRLKGGKVLGILSDLRSKEPGLPIQFLGGTANIAEGMAIFAMHTGVPIFPAFTKRVGWTRHEWKVYDPIFIEKADDKMEAYRDAMQKIMSLLEQDIRANPEQYFWFNKRWVLDPLEEDAGNG